MPNIAWTSSKQGRYREAEMLQTQVLETRKKILGEQSLDTLYSTHEPTLSRATWDASHGNEQEKIGAGHPRTSMIMGYLASAIRSQGWYTEAEQLMKQVTEKSEQGKFWGR
ncbi:hypothetical protein N7532_007412 [Penicillium argentinense]|uniref:Uncharacterized protein n=1 Tax=Penicillium argentinense TaxID=1131581 RepID=A0A9W9F7M6_9EURO|nr:uncharacterized protein N7532_007412 [Penicillium argentinense]KAJ5095121.1 hypothetical protein N7532_007412 [Penicillium argentinense]